MIRGKYIYEWTSESRGFRTEVQIRPQWMATVSDTTDRDGYWWWGRDGERLRHEGPAGRLNGKFKDTEWEDVWGFRGRHDVESVAGEWTRINCTCWDGMITVSVNDQVVNQIKEVSVTAGQILLQCEGAEGYFRRVGLGALAGGGERRGVWGGGGRFLGGARERKRGGGGVW